MKLQSKSDEIWTQGVNFGIVRLGPAAGKVSIFKVSLSLPTTCFLMFFVIFEKHYMMETSVVLPFVRNVCGLFNLYGLFRNILN